MDNKEPIKVRLSTVILVFIIFILLIVIGYLIIKIQNASPVVLTTNSESLANKVIDSPNNTVVENELDVGETEKELSFDEITEELDEDEIFEMNSFVTSDNTYILRGTIYKKLVMTKSELEELAAKGTYEYKNLYGIGPDSITYEVKKDYVPEDADFKYDYAFLANINDENLLSLVARKADSNSYYIETLTEFPTQWVETDIHKQITLDGDTKCVYSIESYDEATDTVSNVFGDELFFGNYFTFSFENGKCTSVNEVVTGH